MLFVCFSHLWGLIVAASFGVEDSEMAFGQDLGSRANIQLGAKAVGCQPGASREVE